MKPGLEVSVELGPGVDPAVPVERVAAAARATLRAVGVATAELSLTLVDDAEIERLNVEYLGHAGPTDVISFPLTNPGGPVVGDVYLGAEQARRQAGALGIDPEEELLRLAIHGTLHVLGFEHPEHSGREDSEMYRRQEEILAAVLSTGD